MDLKTSDYNPDLMVKYTPSDFSLDNYSWEQIKKMSNNGELKERFNYGASKRVTLKDGKKAAATVVGFKGDINDGVPLAGAVFQLTLMEGNNGTE